MSERFFAEFSQEDGARLEGPEAQHLVKVLRARPGDEIVLFNGRGWEGLARIREIRRQSVECDVLSTSEVDRELPRPITLAVSLPKGDRQRFLVEKLTELGVRQLIPLVASRSVVQPAEQVVERLERAVIEASKQCGRNRLLNVSPPKTIPQLFADIPASARRWLAHPGGSKRTCELSDECRTEPDSPLVVAIGPEGGFTSAEVAAAQAAGWAVLDLGPRLLRVETAALAVASLAALV